MKSILSTIVFVLAMGLASAPIAQTTGRCCQLEPGPQICGTCTKEQCGGSGGCSNCNSSSVFQGEPGFEQCNSSRKPKMCEWKLYKKECAKWSVPQPGKAGHAGQTTIGGKPPAGGTGKVCLKWVKKFVKSDWIPCDQTLQSTDPDYNWEKQ